MKKRRCVHDPRKSYMPLKAQQQRSRLDRRRLFEGLVKFLKKHKVSEGLLRDMRSAFSIIDALGPEPTWSVFCKAAKLIIQKFGYDAACKARTWLEQLDACLEVELGCAYPAEVKRLDREWRKKNPLSPIGKPIPPMPLTLKDALLTINGDLTFDVSKGGKKKGAK